MLIGKQHDGRVTEIELQDFDFIEAEFLSKGEVNKNFKLYELVDQEGDVPSSLIQNEEENFQSTRDSRNDLPPSGSIPLEKDSQEPQACRSKCEKNPKTSL